jgi:hypothetical protein
MIKDLVKVATKLDSLGLTKEADVVDALIRKIAETGDDEFSTMWNSLSNEEKDEQKFKTKKYIEMYRSFCENPESEYNLQYWSHEQYSEYFGEYGYPMPTEERKAEILEEVKRDTKGMLLRGEKYNEEISERENFYRQFENMSEVQRMMTPPRYHDMYYGKIPFGK